MADELLTIAILNNRIANLAIRKNCPIG